ncbi:MAG: DMT family transporter [Alphaproteobacteria bacterium]|nr:DMT family transporter [Alphaproteobacteria bacterium]
MELWIPLTITAAFLQNARSAIQKHLTSDFTATQVTYARFLWGFPLALVYLGVLTMIGKAGPVAPTTETLMYAAIGGIAQAAATILMIKAMVLRSFAVGNALTKTEAAQTAILGIIVLGEAVTPGVAAAIAVSLVGVMLVSGPKWHSLFSRDAFLPALCGLGSGALFGVSGVCYRAASLSLELDNFVWAAALVLAIVTGLQSIGMTAVMQRLSPGTPMTVVKGWRRTGIIGVISIVGSACWFTAFSLEPAAHVRALGQIEMVFTFLAAIFFFRERITIRDTVGILMISGALILLVLATG